MENGVDMEKLGAGDWDAEKDIMDPMRLQNLVSNPHMQSTVCFLTSLQAITTGQSDEVDFSCSYLTSDLEPMLKFGNA